MICFALPVLPAHRVRLGVTALVLVLAACSGGDGGSGGSPTAPPLPVSIVLSPQTLQLNVGESSQLFASVTNGSKGVRWTSSAATVAQVDAVGVVTGRGAGSALVTATSLDNPAVSASATVSVMAVPSTVITIEVTNVLLNAVAVSVNGVVKGSVAANSTGTFSVNRTSTLSVEWDLVRSTTTSGTPVGDVIGGSFPTVTDPADRLTYTVDAVIGDARIFMPIVQNQTAVQLLMGVNEGLQSQNRCNCLVPAFATGTSFGYYRLYSNSNVRGYKAGSNYTGSYIYWETFSSSVDATSGSLRLTASSAPPAPPAGSAAAGVVIAPTPGPESVVPPPTSMAEDTFKPGR